MPSRFAKQKPDPAIKRNARRARARMQDTKGERELVAAASLAATILAWVALSLPNLLGSAPTTTGSQLSADTSQNTASTTIQTAAATGQASITAFAFQDVTASGLAAASTSSQVAIASNNVNQPQPFVRTRSSR